MLGARLGMLSFISSTHHTLTFKFQKWQFESYRILYNLEHKGMGKMSKSWHLPQVAIGNIFFLHKCLICTVTAQILDVNILV